MRSTAAWLTSLLTPLAIACGGGDGADDADGVDDDPLPEPTTHFADEPVAWTTPTSDYVSGYYLAGTTSFDTGSWNVLDLDGDGRPDLVRFTAAGQEGDERIVQFGHPSAPYWEVYLGGEGGFAAEPIEWTTPTSDYVSGYYVAGTTSFDTGSWGLLDLDGDRRPDLVRFTAAGQEGDERIVQFGHPSDAHWEVYLGGEGGFATEPIEWATPTSDYVSGYYVAGNTSFDTGSWALLELTGDRRPDLVRFTAAGQEGDERIVQFGHPSDAHWEVYLGGEGGFATEPVEWATPTSDYVSGYYVAGNTSFDTGSWGVHDVDGDRHPDLVRFTAAGQEGDERIVQFGHPSAPHWEVFRGGADGFAAEAIDWATPTSDYVSGFYSAGTTSFDTGSWALLDLDGDLRVDLIEFTAAGQGHAVVGQPRGVGLVGVDVQIERELVAARGPARRRR
jgi:hypothetical protein